MSRVDNAGHRHHHQDQEQAGDDTHAEKKSGHQRLLAGSSDSEQSSDAADNETSASTASQNSASGTSGTSGSSGSSGAGDDFGSVLTAYNDMQENAYTATGTHHKGQSVTDDDVKTLKEALDSYIQSHYTGSSQSAMLKTVDEKTSALTDIIDAPEHGTQSTNSAWDNLRGDLESFLAEVSPSDSSQIWTPDTGGGGGGATGTSTGADGITGTNLLALPSGSSDSESGTGWDGNLNQASTSKTYKGKSLDQLLADKGSLVATEIGNQPDLVAAIRKVSGEYGIPDGLLAATIIQESNGDRTCKTYNSGYEGSAPGDQCYDVGVIQSPLWQFPGSTTAEKMKNAEDPVQCLTNFAKEASADYKKSGSWGVALRNWNSGGNANPNNLSSLTDGYGVASYVSNILGNIATGGGDYDG